MDILTTNRLPQTGDRPAGHPLAYTLDNVATRERAEAMVAASLSFFGLTHDEICALAHTADLGVLVALLRGDRVGLPDGDIARLLVITDETLTRADAAVGDGRSTRESRREIGRRYDNLERRRRRAAISRLNSDIARRIGTPAAFAPKRADLLADGAPRVPLWISMSF